MTIAFLGDSITLGYALDDKKYRYATLVSENLNMTEENYGITGTLVAKAGLLRTVMFYRNAEHCRARKKREV